LIECKHYSSTVPEIEVLKYVSDMEYTKSEVGLFISLG